MQWKSTGSAATKKMVLMIIDDVVTGGGGLKGGGGGARLSAVGPLLPYTGKQQAYQHTYSLWLEVEEGVELKNTHSIAEDRELWLTFLCFGVPH